MIFKVFLWTGNIKAVQGNSTMLHNFAHPKEWVTQEEIKTHWGTITCIKYSRVRSNCLTNIYCLYDTVKHILGYCAKHPKAKVTREKQSMKKKFNAGLKVLYLEKCQVMWFLTLLLSICKVPFFFPFFLQVEQLCFFHAYRAKQDASMELPTVGKLTTWVPLGYFLLLEKPYILLTTPAAVSIKEEISMHSLKRWTRENLWDFFS